ncbi:helix-turn-helix transcriptional regulator [Corynebacterium sp. 320]|uniref:TetR/AcrR family transcriptional regulator n=1 Tax=Corynebacterium TaxID=1716 RepID=UPI00125CACD8|nr:MULTISPECIES: TetR/AcrR family transcriptional regulator [Corynebacterium]KAB1551253.1 helix-turn-helix transcriptional regulator [Corynebacterium sp. 321]KAB1502526.1 helix-turn-helix transcriptional regulator [Corynebacterium sp. 320]KAB1551919.1 helix-turn-helix transcriptional regulator [Corynebacterium sp. 319]KAB3526133.1 helix-turn-helix transcriptional regulator [Corynebacterium sp. 250]KAB3538913.1 helix-turn-helix transcriptional regulator [Corynebacterium sp. 366]
MQLHRALILETATDILREYGLADLTMRRLARQLGVAPGALYWHFSSKQALLGAIADTLIQGINHNEEDLETYCAALFTALCSLPSGAEITLAASASGTLEHDPSTHLSPAVWHYVLGAAMDHQAREEAAQRLGVDEPHNIDVIPGVRALLSTH